MNVPSQRPFVKEEDISDILEDVKNTLRTGRFVLGPYTKRFEENFGKYVGTDYAVATSCCTSALEIVLRYFDIRNREVIVPTNTFIACPNAVIYAGGKPVFADIRADSFCLDVDQVEKKIRPETRAVMAVHLGGLPIPEMKALVEICEDKGLFLLEDCAHAHGAAINGERVGSLANGGCFSFFATKIMTTGTGGMITTDDSALASYALALRHQGGIGGEGQIERFEKFGYDWMMNEFTAIIGISQMKKLEENLARRSAIASRYEVGLSEFDDISFNPVPQNIRHAYWRFITTLSSDIDRDRLRQNLRTKYNIEVGSLYPVPCHLQPLYRNMGHKEGECPVAERELKKQITLPVHPMMGDREVDYVLSSLKKEISNSRVKGK